MNVPLQLEMSLSAAHRNRYLFSDHYLAHILPTDPRWDAALPEAEAFLAWLQELYARERDQLSDYNESQLEQYWFRPILEQLGHVFEVQASVPGLDAYAKRPDYVFFPDEATRQAAAGAQNQAAYAEQALAVGEVKRWDRSLGKKKKGGGPSFEDRNPSWQIDYYIRATGLAWGILTNGRLWRLVHEDTSQRLQIYYEVDLIELLEAAEPGRMRYFALFFRQAALRPDQRGRVFLDDALAASDAYAVALEEDLEENVYHALERLLQGFLDLPANGLGPDALRAVYDNSLYLLYRLLFILYGESRGLLPLDNDRYRAHYSLTRIKNDIAELETPPAPRTRLYWGRLQTLFHIINGDDAELNRSLGVPRYDGGLFDPQQHAFLEEKAVGDRALVEAIDLLSRRETEAGREFADYRTLGVRHLGSIYEGLLEYQPRYAEAPVVAIRDGSDERWVKAAEAPEEARVIERREAGQVYLETDRGERKATGSYYTPQYIVAYIVDHTLGPLVQEALQRVRARAKAADGRVARAEAEQSLVEEILDLKVLDPAMGSGHFLVEATEFLALALATDPYVTTEETPEEDLTYWKRRVVERCIYGVDKNRLAVELAKLSLWLATVAADRPLSFLDHHLQHGDSLIGARVADLGEVPPVMLNKKQLREREARYQAGVRQANLFETRLVEKLPTVMGRILEITEKESDSYESVQAKEAADQAVRELKAPFEAVADLWTSAYFGNAFINGEYDGALLKIGQPDELVELPAVRRAKAIADERSFLHWELAFPEVFYDEQGQRLGERAGFDAVVGNPPYVRSVRLKAAEPMSWAYYSQVYQTASKREFDIYLCFAELGLRLLNQHGHCGMIMPNKWLTTRVGEALRLMIAKHKAITYIVDFGHFQVFDGVTTYTCLLFLNGSPQEKARIAVLADAEKKAHPLPGREGRWQTGKVKIEDLGAKAWSFALGPAGALLEKLEILPRLEGVATVFKGTGTSADAVYFMERRERRFYSRSLERWVELEDALMRPALTGQDIDPYHYEPSNYLLFPYHFVGDEVELVPPDEMAAQYPQAWAYLNHPTNREILEGRDKGLFGGQADWYAYGRPQNMHLLDKDKIVGPDVAGQAEFVYDSQGRYIIDTVYAIRTLDGIQFSLLALTALLNSSVMTFFLQQTGTDLRGGYFRIKTAYLNPFPIPRIEFTTPTDEREALVAAGITEATEWVETTESGSGVSVTFSAFSGSNTGRWLDERLSAEPEQADVVHDLLAHLAERMMALHQEKQARVEAFWLDLEGVTDADTFETLRQRGKWEASLWKDKACRPFVAEESRSTRHLDESLGWNEDCFKVFVKMLVGRIANLSDVVGVYRKHHPAYHRLGGRIVATDRLIDQVVYRLYGLTAEEIAIVEGAD